MDIKALELDLRERQKILVEQLNDVISQQQALANRREELTREALRLNGEADMLRRLSGNGKK